MNESIIHNPDRYMVDLRQILSQGRKRIGILVGAGAPVSVRVDSGGQIDPCGGPLIPDVAGLTSSVIKNLDAVDKTVVDALIPELGENPNIETILTRVRRLSEAIGAAEIHGFNGEAYGLLAERICKRIGEIVAAILPEGPSPYTELISWIGGTQRVHPVEIFSPNYDLLLEEAFERARYPYFDGFSGSHKPFFDPASISEDLLPPRWSRLWKIHGSLGWEVNEEVIVRTGSRDATKLIYPDHLKYDQITRQPYSALFERLREFLATPDSLLLCTGFSFFDAHITAIIDEALAANSHTAILAFQFRDLEQESQAAKLAKRRPNFSLYARNGAVIFGSEGKWKPGQLPSDEWASIRSTFWEANGGDSFGEFLLGDFARFSRFLAHAQATELRSAPVLGDLSVGAEEKDSGKSVGIEDKNAET